MTYVFDGKKYAKMRELGIIDKVSRLRAHGVIPHLAIIIAGYDKASRLYVSLKQKVGERLGMEVEVIDHSHSTFGQVVEDIKRLNSETNVHGVMVQLPLPKSLAKHTDKILQAIASQKDVDGLREGSHYVPATVKAALAILNEAKHVVKVAPDALYLVVGAKGVVGSKIVSELTEYGCEVEVFDKDDEVEKMESSLLRADVVISATGIAGLITKDIVKKGSIVIDIGSPQGDVDFEGVSEVAKFITPVPGGVGPVTIVSLFENLILAASV